MAVRRSTHPVLELSGSELARLIRLRRCSSEQVVRAHIDRAVEVNGRLNALVCDRFDAALDEARRADDRIRAEPDAEHPPFLGVPCTIKEAFALTGMPNSSGLVSRIGRTATSDATAVARLRAAGAIPIGVTNVSELCMWMESDNRVYGRTKNPYDARRTVGGSSGGEGAMIGAGAVPFGLGSDVGGSIRMPAFFNGIFGHKPTGGLVPNTGQFPNAHGDARRYLTTGPLCRRAVDLMPLLRVLAGPDGVDEGCTRASLGDPDAVDLSRLSVLVVEGNGIIDVAPELLRAQWSAARSLERRGARVRREEIKALRQSFQIWGAMLAAAGGPSFASLMGDGSPINPFVELARWAVGRSTHTFPAIGLAVLEKLPQWLPSYADDYVRQGHLLRQELVDRIGPDGIMLFPSFPRVAPRHRAPLFPPHQWIYTAIFNVMELPSTQVPLGLDRRGLPLGVQVVSVHGNDHVTIAVAQHLERAFGGWVPPPT
jgi:fatty acid amide hydrolase 2